MFYTLFIPLGRCTLFKRVLSEVQCWNTKVDLVFLFMKRVSLGTLNSIDVSVKEWNILLELTANPVYVIEQRKLTVTVGMILLWERIKMDGWMDGLNVVFNL